MTIAKLLPPTIETLNNQSYTFPNSALFNGQVKDGYLEGDGTITWPDGSTYAGQFSLNKPNGIGIYKWPNGIEYNGEVKDVYRNGFGTLLSSSYIAAGEWKQGKLHGKAKVTVRNGTGEYDGEWIEGSQTGHGMVKYQSGNVYEGELKDGLRHGQGKMTWKNLKQVYQGSWENGVPHGLGEYTWNLSVENKRFIGPHKYIGNWIHGKREGEGKYLYADGSEYTGYFLNNRKHGPGSYRCSNGSYLIGDWHNDRFQGTHNFNQAYVFPLSKLSDKASINMTTDALNTLIHSHSDLLWGIYNRFAETVNGYRILTRYHMWKILDMYGLYAKGVCAAAVDDQFGADYETHPHLKHRFENPHDKKEKLLFVDFVNYLIHVGHSMYADKKSSKIPFAGYAGSLYQLLENDLSSSATTSSPSSTVDVAYLDSLSAEYSSISNAKQKAVIREVIIKLKQVLPNVDITVIIQNAKNIFPGACRTGELSLIECVGPYQYAQLRSSLK